MSVEVREREHTPTGETKTPLLKLVGIPSAVVQNRNRTPTVVLPAAAAAMAPVLPMPGWQGRR